MLQKDMNTEHNTQFKGEFSKKSSYHPKSLPPKIWPKFLWAKQGRNFQFPKKCWEFVDTIQEVTKSFIPLQIFFLKKNTRNSAKASRGVL